jgi:hypothetical protein
MASRRKAVNKKRREGLDNHDYTSAVVMVKECVHCKNEGVDYTPRVFPLGHYSVHSHPKCPMGHTISV